MTKITFSALSFCFPNDTLWVTAGAEIVGYSVVKNLHFVISDGNCMSERWTVHVFSPNDKNIHQQTWYPLAKRTPIKYPSEDISIKLLEEVVNFDSSVETILLRDKIKSI